MVNAGDVTEWFGAGKAALDIMKAARDLMPKGKDKDAVDGKIVETEKALEIAAASAAKELGYRLCRCTFPPQIMLWQKESRTNVCPTCGDQHPPPNPQVNRQPPPGGPQAWTRR